MGFFDIIKEVGKTAGKAAAEYSEKCNKIRSEYEDKSDQELLRIVRGETFISASMTEKSVAMSILKRRGYSREEIMGRS